MGVRDRLIGLLGGSTVAPVSEMVPAGAGGEQAMGAFDGADRFNHALALWQPSLGSADLDVIPDMQLGDARSRDMLRNDGYVNGGATLRKDNIVGAQYVLNAKPASRVLFGAQDDDWEAEFQEEVEELFDLAAESPDNLFDASRMNTFTGLIRLGVGVHLAGGEVLSTVEWIRNGRPFNTAIQMIDKDRLSTPTMIPYSAGATTPLALQNIRAGVRLDNYGAPLSYFIRTQHPNDFFSGLGVPPPFPMWNEVPIRKPWGRLQVIHIIEQMRPAQTRGIAAMVSALKEMHITRRFRDVTLQNAVTQAMYAAAITSERPPAEAFQLLGGGQMDAQAFQKMQVEYLTGYMGAIGQFAGSAKNLQVDGVRIPWLPPGTKLDMIAPSNGGPLGMEFEQSLLRYIAAALGVSYEQLSRDYTQTNYSSARAAMAETWKFMQALKKAVADRLATIIFRLWLEEMVNGNRLTTFPKSKAPILYENNSLGFRFDALSRCDWIGASRGQIDELKETQAAVLRINNGLSTLEEEIARLGGDWRKKLRQRARELKLVKMLEEQNGVVIINATQTNGMENAVEGAAQPTDSPNPDGEGKKK